MVLPAIGMRTFGSDKYDENVVAHAVEYALNKGYRYKMYDSELS